MRFWLLLAGGLLISATGAKAQIRPVALQQATNATDALGSTAIDAGDYVYVSGQGPRTRDGSTPAGFPAQVRQCLDNIRTVVETAGLTMNQSSLSSGLSRRHEQLR